MMIRRRLMSPALVVLGSLISVALGIVLYATPARAAGQKQPPIA
jgi:hypothetical protein